MVVSSGAAGGGEGPASLALAVVDELDPPLLEHPVHGVDLERRERVRLEHLESAGSVDGARDLCGLEEL